jgi:D-tyrosyl-tRNA(Tyr) deacylase
VRVLIQRVTSASVTVDGKITGQIGGGLLVLLGVAKPDTAVDADYLVEKVLNLRVFNDSAGRMNLSLLDTGGGLLCVSQFTLYGDTRKGRRPGFDAAAGPEQARMLYEYFVAAARKAGAHVETGIFQAHMEVALVNDGPVTLMVESPEKPVK